MNFIKRWTDIYVGVRNALLVSIAQPFFVEGSNATVGVLGINIVVYYLYCFKYDIYYDTQESNYRFHY